MIKLLAICALPWLMFGAEDQSCWLRDAVAPSAQTVYALCEQGGLWTTLDGGSTWKKQETGATGPVRAMAFLDAQRGLIVGDHGLVLATTDGGKNWERRTIDTKEHLMDIAFVGESGWITGYQGIIFHTADGGRTWARQQAGTTQTLETVFFLDADHGWVVGWAGTILRTSDGGAKWEKVRAEAATWSLTSVYFRDAKNGWMAGFAGQIFRSADGGATWKAQTSPVKSWLTAVTFDKANRGWIAYDDGLLVSEDGGETWKTVAVGGRYFLAKLVPVGDALWVLGQSVILKQGDGLKWTRIDSLVPGRSSIPTRKTE